MNIVTNVRQLGKLRLDEMMYKRKALLDSHLAPVSSRHRDIVEENETNLRSR